MFFQREFFQHYLTFDYVENFFIQNMAAQQTKISKCNNGRCSTCLFVKNCDNFKSTNTNRIFFPILKSCLTLNCTTENVVYLITCNLCNIQYIGETKNSVRVRFNGHKSSIKSGKSSQLVHHHFHNECHGLNNCSILPIEKIEALGLNDQALKNLRLERELFWTKMLQTSYPLGLNVRLKGIGDYHPSQDHYRDYGGRRRRNK